MAQFARPVQDISINSWRTQANGSTNLWSTIDESSADDADYVISALGDNTTYEVKLSSVAPAVIPRNHSITLRGRKSAANGNTKGVTVALVQGTTVIGSQNYPDLAATVSQQTIDMPKAMTAGITDYADLRFRFTPLGITSGGSSRRQAVITGIQLRVPSASDLVDDLLVRWGITFDNTGGNWTVNKSGFTGIGSSLSRSIWDLYQSMRVDEVFYEANAAEIERKFDIAYGLHKVIQYEQYRADLVGGIVLPPSSKTLPEALAIVDQKISTFISKARASDAGEPA